MDLCFVCWENVGKDRKSMPGCYVVLWFLLFLGSLTWGKAWVLLSVVVWGHRLIVGLSMFHFIFFLYLCVIYMATLYVYISTYIATKRRSVELKFWDMCNCKTDKQWWIGNLAIFLVYNRTILNELRHCKFSFFPFLSFFLWLCCRCCNEMT